MTIGPAPIRQMDWRSGRLGKAAHLLHPTLEDRPGIVRSRAGLGMELDRMRAQTGKVEPFDRSVVERDVRGLTILAGATAKPWFWLVTSTRPVARSSTG